MFDHFDPLSLGFDPVYPDSKAHICFIKHFFGQNSEGWKPRSHDPIRQLKLCARRLKFLAVSER